MRALWTMVVVAAVSGCGFGGSTQRLSSKEALSSTAEWLEFEPAAVRAELFREVAATSVVQQGRTGAVLFPMLTGGHFVGAPAIDGRADLLTASAGPIINLTFDRTQPFSEDRRDAFQGLSEREAAEQVARTLLAQWGVTPTGPVIVVRTARVPYAAAYMDGELRLNPAFLYMAAAPTAP